MASPLFLLGCGPQSTGRRIYPHPLWVLALRVSPAHYRIYHFPSSTGPLSGRTVSVDELSQSLRPTSGYVVGHIPASEASTVERALKSLTVSTIYTTNTTSTPATTISQDEEYLYQSRWPEVLQSLRHLNNNSHGIRDTQSEMREAVLERWTEQWNSRTSTSSFVDWLATITIDTTDSDSDAV